MHLLFPSQSFPDFVAKHWFAEVMSRFCVAETSDSWCNRWQCGNAWHPCSLHHESHSPRRELVAGGPSVLRRVLVAVTSTLPFGWLPTCCRGLPRPKALKGGWVDLEDSAFGALSGSGTFGLVVAASFSVLSLSSSSLAVVAAFADCSSANLSASILFSLATALSSKSGSAACRRRLSRKAVASALRVTAGPAGFGAGERLVLGSIGLGIGGNPGGMKMRSGITDCCW